MGRGFESLHACQVLKDLAAALDLASHLASQIRAKAGLVTAPPASLEGPYEQHPIYVR